MSKETIHAFLTLYEDRMEWKVMLPYAKGSYIEGSDPYWMTPDDLPQKLNERFIVGQTILRLVRLNGVTNFQVNEKDDLPNAMEYRGSDYGDDDILSGE